MSLKTIYDELERNDNVANSLPVAYEVELLESIKQLLTEIKNLLTP